MKNKLFKLITALALVIIHNAKSMESSPTPQDEFTSSLTTEQQPGLKSDLDTLLSLESEFMQDDRAEDFSKYKESMQNFIDNIWNNEDYQFSEEENEEFNAMYTAMMEDISSYQNKKEIEKPSVLEPLYKLEGDLNYVEIMYRAHDNLGNFFVHKEELSEVIERLRKAETSKKRLNDKEYKKTSEIIDRLVDQVEKYKDELDDIEGCIELSGIFSNSGTSIYRPYPDKLIIDYQIKAYRIKQRLKETKDFKETLDLTKELDSIIIEIVNLIKKQASYKKEVAKKPNPNEIRLIQKVKKYIKHNYR